MAADAPHIDAVGSVIDYRVPPERVTALAAFDDSVVVERTAGEVSARCHNEQANFLALNLMHDTVTGKKSVDEARAYYAKELADYRRKKPTPYMEWLRFIPGDGGAADPTCGFSRTRTLRKRRRRGSRASQRRRAS